jgi:uncharacterized protein
MYQILAFFFVFIFDDYVSLFLFCSRINKLEKLMDESEKIIQVLDLVPHPEGGYYNEVYRSAEVLLSSALPSRYKSSRSFSTSIYFMLCRDQVSHFHNVQSDETWHFYKGSSLILHCFDINGYSKKIIGCNILVGQLPQFTIPKGTWFAAEVEDKTSYSLIGCTVAPGFDFADFELAVADNLAAIYPTHKDLIKKLSMK